MGLRCDAGFDNGAVTSVMPALELGQLKGPTDSDPYKMHEIDDGDSGGDDTH